jgi:hypothetical protein
MTANAKRHIAGIAGVMYAIIYGFWTMIITGEFSVILSERSGQKYR